MSPQELDGLIAAHFAGTLDAGEQKLLGDALLADESARRRFVELADQEAALRTLKAAERQALAVGRKEAQEAQRNTGAPSVPSASTPCASCASLRQSPRPSPPAPRRSGWLLPAAAAAALIVVSGLFASGILPSGNVKIRDFDNTSGKVVVEKLSDGTRLAIAPGAKLVATGRDQARRVRQLIRLEAGEVEVRAPKASTGEVACRVETPEGLWVETVGTVFSVTRAWENEKGERNVDKSKLTGVLTAVLLVAVSEGEVRTGNAIAEETRVAAGNAPAVVAEVRRIPKDYFSASCQKSPLVFVGKVVKADLAAKLWSGYALITSEVSYEVEKVLKGTAGKEVTIKVAILMPSPLMAKNAEGQKVPALDPRLFAVGERHVVCVDPPIPGQDEGHLVGEKIWAATEGNLRIATEVSGQTGLSWGQAANGLRLGVKLAAPAARVESGKTIALATRLENVDGEKVVAVWSRSCSWGHGLLTSIFTEAGTGKQHKFVEPVGSWRRNVPDLQSLKPGEAQETGLTDAAFGATLPPGKYRLVVTYANADNGAAVMKARAAWTGEVSSGPVEIEIVAPGGAKAPDGGAGWLELLDDQPAYKDKPGDEQVFKGRLDILRPITELDGFAYRLFTPDGGGFTLGVGITEALEKLRDAELKAGRPAEVEVRGKPEKNVRLYKGEGGTGTVLWPGVIRLAAAPNFSSKCERPGDEVVAEVVGGALVLTVTSPGGIGSAEVKPDKGEWPKKVAVRLLLKGLEGFSAECGGKKLSGFINSSGAKGGELAAEKKGDVIEVALPEGFAAGKDAVLKLSWVDFYR